MHAMGQLALPACIDACLDVLNRTNQVSPTCSSEEDRATACWALSRLPTLPQPVIQRLSALVSRPVVHTDMGNTYDSDVVRVAATWSLVWLVKRDRDPDLEGVARSAIGLLKMPDPNPDQMSNNPIPLPTSEALRAFGAEAEQFLAGQPIERHPVTAGTYRFSFSANASN